MRNLHHCMVPMTVHQVVGSIGGGLVEVAVAVARRLYSALYVTDVHDLLTVRRDLELADAVGYIADLPVVLQ